MKTAYADYTNMLCALYRDVASAYPAQNIVEHTRDILLIKQRVKCEGVTFLTKTLPLYGKAIDKALARGTHLIVPAFAKKRGTAAPRFLGWLLGKVFNEEGLELEESDPIALVYLRQLLYLFYKLEMPYADKDVKRVLEEFKSTDAGLGKAWHISDPFHKMELNFARQLVCRVLGNVDPRFVMPRHGPGSVATGEKLDGKAYFVRDYVELTSVYPLDEYFYMNAAHVSECLADNGVNTRNSKGELLPWKKMKHGTAKVVLVPKDSRGPRLISMEPLEIQWIQQGQCERLVRRLESHWLTKGNINFTSQDINRYLAWRSSLPDDKSSALSLSLAPNSLGPAYAGDLRDPSVIAALPSYMEIAKPSCRMSWTSVHDGERTAMGSPETHQICRKVDLVTLDMKEASDRVSVGHIVNLFPDNWVEALMASRSSHTELPDGEVIALNKFAPMGSAVCFPVEALTFWALALAGLRYADPELARLNTSATLLKKLRDRVWVYGDDIICYREDYPIIEQSLQRTGLLLNENKCCVAGSFRESCGVDAYKGIVVTPLRIKELLPHRWTGQSVMAYVSYSNEAYRRGYTNLAECLEKLLNRNIAIPFTTVNRGGVQFVRPDRDVRTLNHLSRVKTRWNAKLHILEAYGPTPRAVHVSNRNVTFETYLSKVVSKWRNDSIEDPPDIDNRIYPIGDALRADQYSVPRRVTSHRGWTQITL
jgi:hypothetical protein